ncbi:hypothetical protein A7985_17990 [Pseudoalteromonas luteoviolacea]|uniref:Uncharacterized protein n=1 Tax=Pseudoalteromonas luteoviolacea TaxID=43657 RepID=A0A1C0TN33_9GAMM|nr:hypothetical protein [Pseudoalteromonas luteoviolacea]MBQ4812191.1 hypothetical protein [Pseudoalteromonas luteoviolacea]OCQ20313.1 hypothetical protein A7985_17990 [Pseudoalteromonas luteoviolacea]
MSEFLSGLGWLIRFLEVLIICFLVIKFWQHKFSLFFGGKSSLQTIEDHELHSCFLTALCALVFHFIGVEVSKYILSLPLDKMPLRRTFYFSNLLVVAACITTLYVLHSIRECSYSNTAKRIGYLAIVTATLQMTQLIARGYLDYNGLYQFYNVFGALINVTTLAVIAAYPIKIIKNYKMEGSKEVE